MQFIYIYININIKNIMDDQFDNRQETGFSMNGDAFDPTVDTYKDSNIPSLTHIGLNEDDSDNWREQMNQDLRGDMGIPTTDNDVNELKDMLMAPSDESKSDTLDPIIEALKDIKDGKNVVVKNDPPSLRVAPNACGCCYGNDGKCFNPVEKINRQDRKTMNDKRVEYNAREQAKDTIVPHTRVKKKGPPHDLSKDDPKIKAEIIACKKAIIEYKAQIKMVTEKKMSIHLINRLNKAYENKLYELTCLEDSLNPESSKMKKMEVFRAQYFNLEKQKAEIDLKMQAIEMKFRAENMSIEERDMRPDVETLIQSHDDDQTRLWKLRANRLKIYNAEYNVGKDGVTTHDKSDFKKDKFMRKQLVAHRARNIVSNHANGLT
jgi:hypothetical protein